MNDASLGDIGGDIVDQSERAGRGPFDLDPLDLDRSDVEVTDQALKDAFIDAARQDMERDAHPDRDLDLDLALAEDATLDAALELDEGATLDGALTFDSLIDAEVFIGCGDGVIQSELGETCDEPGESATCNADCTSSRCGDGRVNRSAGEACDDISETSVCNQDCTWAECGDGYVNQSAGEECDDRGESATCNAQCRLARCGDGVVNQSAGEACDDRGDSTTCTDSCQLKRNPLTFVDVALDRALGQLRDHQVTAVADYDRDGHLDLFIVSQHPDDPADPRSHSRLLRNGNDGHFIDVTQEANLSPQTSQPPLPLGGVQITNFSSTPGAKFGASWGDYDGDGDPDLFLTYLYSVHLYQNQGDGAFVEVTEEAGINAENGCFNTGATWFDVDRDGDLDLFICDWGVCDHNTLYLNEGDGMFRDATSDFNLDAQWSSYSFNALPLDVNRDGWPDLYVMNDLDGPSRLYINQQGISFTEEAFSYGLDHRGDDMGVAVMDYNLDGRFDLYISTIDENALLEQGVTGYFNDVGAARGVREAGWGWSVLFSDFDLDGDEDLFTTTGMLTPEPNLYFENTALNLSAEGAVGFTDRSEHLGLSKRTNSLGAVELDYDHDGDLDIALADNTGPFSLYENQLCAPGEPAPVHWLKISLEGVQSNRDGLGAELTLITATQVLHRYYTGVGCLSQSLQPIHFGLGEEDRVLVLIIRWPSGIEDQYLNIEADQEIRATEQLGYETLTPPLFQRARGCTDSNACNYDERALDDDGTCEYLRSDASLIGPHQVMILSDQTYTHRVEGATLITLDPPIDPNLIELHWEVEGGEILEGQGSDEIRVRWGAGERGRVTLLEWSERCAAQPLSVEVELSAEGIAAHPRGLSVARLWSEALLEAIRNDYARPTVHARNLFHVSVAMYDAWALYHPEATTYLMNQQRHGFSAQLTRAAPSDPTGALVIKTISYAAHALISHRFQRAPGAGLIQRLLDRTLRGLGYSVYDASLRAQPELLEVEPWRSGVDEAAALGLEIAATLIAYGHQDGSHELDDYQSQRYQPVNPPLYLDRYSASEVIADPNRWQPLGFETFIDQSGNVLDANIPDFISPEWGDVSPFALDPERAQRYERIEGEYRVYEDPGPPPRLQSTPLELLDGPDRDQLIESHVAHLWGFSLVSRWGAHLDPSDGVMWDISPRSIGGVSPDMLPSSWVDYPLFYRADGGDVGAGHPINPHTNEPYEPVWVPRGDYTRVLAEFWADGPDSETPPGHWFVLLHYVNDQPSSTRRFRGEGEPLSELEWDVKAHFLLGGAMHDAAIAAWSVKGWYDYIRPISAIRSLAARGQSSDEIAPRYHFAGLPLSPGYVEIIEEGDPLSGPYGERVGRLKLYTWRGHDSVSDPETDQAGVGWITADEWWPYQRPTFVTPPFAGYVSGHSTYSRAAAEVLTSLTGSPHFPGGYGEFIARRDEFLVFEEGPSVDVPLRWATYQDAADQCALSRIWGGIHPPADDIAGRRIGLEVGQRAFSFGASLF